jgi:hypothetical protein
VVLGDTPTTQQRPANGESGKHSSFFLLLFYNPIFHPRLLGKTRLPAAKTTLRMEALARVWPVRKLFPV